MIDSTEQYNYIKNKINDKVYNKYFPTFANKTEVISRELRSEGFRYYGISDKYQKDENIEFEYQTPSGENHSLFGYKNCRVVDCLLVDDEQKIYRTLKLSDIKDFDASRMYLYKKKYICFYSNEVLIFPNKKAVIRYPNINVIDDLEIITNDQLYNSYVLEKASNGIDRIRGIQFNEIDDNYTKSYLMDMYHTYMTNQLDRYENGSETSLRKQAQDNFMPNFFLLPYYPKYIDFCEKVLPIDYFLTEITRKREVWKNIKNNVLINELFNANNQNENNYAYGEDYTFMIFNLIKAFEFLLYNILFEKGIKMSDDKDVDEKIMLNSMIQLVKDNKDKLIREGAKEYVTDEIYEKYIEHLVYVKDKCRNGYFHKERMDNYTDSFIKRVRIFNIMIETIALIGR